MAQHVHLSFETLTALETDDQGGRERLRTAFAARCPECLSILAAYLDGPKLRRSAYQGMWHRLDERLAAAVPAVQSEVAEARTTFEDFARRAPAERRTLLAADPRFRGSAFVDRLLDAARETRRSDPASSLEWAGDALAALDRLVFPSHDRRVLALALQANAHRAADDYAAAVAGFARARALAEDLEDDLDLDTLAELDSLEASLLQDLRRLDEAEELLRRAYDTYQELGQISLAAQALIQLGYLYYTAGDPEVAVGPYQAALELLSRDHEPRLYLAARFNLTLALVDSDRIIEARDLLTYDEDLYAAHADEHLTVRQTWLDGRIASATGQIDEAETSFVQVRDAFAARRDGFDAALVSLDLAHLYYGCGRMDDLLETVASAIAVFAAYALHREGLAALIMLRDAVRQKAATAETIERVARFLRESADDPAARFQAPS